MRQWFRFRFPWILIVSACAFCMASPRLSAQTITSINPSSVAAGGPPFQLTVNGSGFNGNQQVRVNGNPRATTFVSTTQVLATVLASDIAAPGQDAITVFNPATGGSSNTVFLTITGAPPPVPTQTVTSINPSSVAAGGSAFQLTLTGTGFTANMQVRVNGTARATTPTSATQMLATILASDIAAPGQDAVTVFNPSTGLSSNTVLLTIGAPPPALTSVGPGIVAPGATGFRMTLIGTNFRPGANVVISPPISSVSLSSASTQASDISIDNVTRISPTLLIALVSVSPIASPSLRAVDVVNADGTSTGSLVAIGTSKALRIAQSNSLGGPLSVSIVALLHPRNGTLIMQGDELYAEATLAGTGSGTVVGAWLWDGNITEQFTAVFAGGQSVAIKSKRPFPTSFLGEHSVELRILEPNQLVSQPAIVVVNPGSWQLQRLLAPAYGVALRAEDTPLFRWALVPGAAKYQVGFSTRPYLSTIEDWHDVNDNQWEVPKDIWSQLPNGDLYWTVRTVEMNGETRKPLPMRLLHLFPANALAPAADHPTLTPAGNPLLEWEGIKGKYFYRITISTDADGNDVVRKYLTRDPHIDLRALAGKWDTTKTYYWRVDAVTPEGRTILTGPTQSFVPPPPATEASPQSSRESRTEPQRFVLASYFVNGASLGPSLKSLMNDSSDVSSETALETVDLSGQIANRSPTPNSTVSDSKAVVSIQFKSEVNPFDLAVMLDDTDVTSLCQVSETNVSYVPATPLSAGEHKIGITIVSDAANWSFKVDPTLAAARTGSAAGKGAGPPGTDAEASPKQEASGNKVAGKTGGGAVGQQNSGAQMDTHFSSNTQWVSGSRPNTNTATFGEQFFYRDGDWTVQMNGSGLLNSVLNPEAMRHSLGRVNDYILQTGVQQGSWGLNIRFGIVAPSLYQNSQFVTTAIPRQGVETMVKTPGGTFGFYANTNDLALGGGSGIAHHQQLEGASWELPLPKKYIELRLMWLSSQDTGSSVFLTPGSGSTVTPSVNSIFPAGGGDLYGSLLLVHLSPKWLWGSEYGWSYNALNLAASSQRLFGWAWRSNISGAIGHAALNFGYFDVGPNFTSPANPALSALSNPGRRGFTTSLALPTTAGTFSLGYSLLESNVNALNFPEQRMNGITENWSKNIDPKTMLMLGSHQTLTTTSNLPQAVKSLSSEQQQVLKADQRDLGTNVTIARQVGKWNLSVGGARDWFRNNILTNANTITSSISAGASLNASNFFQLNSSFGVNWLSGEKNTVGATRTLSGYLQPTFIWQRAKVQVAPLVSYNQSRTELITGILTNNLTTSQYGGRVSWTMPGDFRFSTFSFEGDFTRNKNAITGMDLRDKVLAVIWTVVFGQKRAM